MFFYGCHGESGWEGVLRTGLWVLQSLWLSVCGSPMCCGLLSYYVRVVSLGTTLTSFRASNSKARFSCLTTSHSPTVAVALVKNVCQTFFYCEPSRMTGEGYLRWTRDDGFKCLLIGAKTVVFGVVCFAPICGSPGCCGWRHASGMIINIVILGWIFGL